MATPAIARPDAAAVLGVGLAGPLIPAQVARFILCGPHETEASAQLAHNPGDSLQGTVVYGPLGSSQHQQRRSHIGRHLLRLLATCGQDVLDAAGVAVARQRAQADLREGRRAR
jgi:hypothetical protein